METVAAVAACAQLLGQAIKTTETIAIFCNRIKDSPAELSRLRNDVIFTQQTIAEFRRSFGNADNARASEELGRLVRSKLRDVNDTLDEMCHNCSRWSSGKPTLKTKIKLAFLSSEIAKMLERLRNIRNDLMWLALQMNLCDSDYNTKWNPANALPGGCHGSRTRQASQPLPNINAVFPGHLEKSPCGPTSQGQMHGCERLGFTGQSRSRRPQTVLRRLRFS